MFHSLRAQLMTLSSMRVIELELSGSASVGDCSTTTRCERERWSYVCVVEYELLSDEHSEELKTCVSPKVKTVKEHRYVSLAKTQQRIEFLFG